MIARDAVASAKGGLFDLKLTSAPYDELLDGHAWREVMRSRMNKMKDRIQDILAKELQQAKTVLTEYCKAYLALLHKADFSLQERYLAASDNARRDIMDTQWDVAFASTSKPDDPIETAAAIESLDAISVLVQLPFFLELYFMMPELEEVFLALQSQISEQQGKEEVSKAEKQGMLKQRARDAAAAAAKKINMHLAERLKDKKEKMSESTEAAKDVKK